MYKLCICLQMLTHTHFCSSGNHPGTLKVILQVFHEIYHITNVINCESVITIRHTNNHFPEDENPSDEIIFRDD